MSSSQNDETIVEERLNNRPKRTVWERVKAPFVTARHTYANYPPKRKKSIWATVLGVIAVLVVIAIVFNACQPRNDNNEASPVPVITDSASASTSPSPSVSPSPSASPSVTPSAPATASDQNEAAKQRAAAEQKAAEEKAAADKAAADKAAADKAQAQAVANAKAADDARAKRLAELGYGADKGWIANPDAAAWADIARNNPGLMAVGTSFATTPEEAAAAAANNPTVKGTYAEKANPSNWVAVYNPLCMTYPSMAYQLPDGSFVWGGGFRECGVMIWVNTASGGQFRPLCDNGVEEAPVPTNEAPSFPKLEKPIEELTPPATTVVWTPPTKECVKSESPGPGWTWDQEHCKWCPPVEKCVQPASPGEGWTWNQEQCKWTPPAPPTPVTVCRPGEGVVTLPSKDDMLPGDLPAASDCKNGDDDRVKDIGLNPAPEPPGEPETEQPVEPAPADPPSVTPPGAEDPVSQAPGAETPATNPGPVPDPIAQAPAPENPGGASNDPDGAPTAAIGAVAPVAVEAPVVAPAPAAAPVAAAEIAPVVEAAPAVAPVAAPVAVAPAPVAVASVPTVVSTSAQVAPAPAVAPAQQVAPAPAPTAVHANSAPSVASAADTAAPVVANGAQP